MYSNQAKVKIIGTIPAAERRRILHLVAIDVDGEQVVISRRDFQARVKEGQIIYVEGSIIGGDAEVRLVREVDGEVHFRTVQDNRITNNLEELPVVTLTFRPNNVSSSPLKGLAMRYMQRERQQTAQGLEKLRSIYTGGNNGGTR